MIVFETLFALLYAFIYDHRLPRPLEVAAIALLVAGVSWSVRQHADDGACTVSIEEKAEASPHRRACIAGERIDHAPGRRDARSSDQPWDTYERPRKRPSLRQTANQLGR